MKCFYHSADLDGKASAAIVRRKYPNCGMYPINYGNDFPWDDIEKNEKIFMVDFSLDIESMIRLKSRADLVVIDHHSSFLRDALYWGITFQGILREGLGACALVWEYLYPETSIPYSVQLLADYDVWNHENPDVLPFQYGLRLEDNEPDSEFWDKIFTPDVRLVNKIIKAGHTVLRYEAQSNEIFVKAAAFPLEFEGLKFIAANRTIANSKLFDSIWDPDVYDAMMLFGWRKGRWIFSLYSEHDVDVSEIAIKYGGGGHKTACGFNLDSLPFELPLKEVK